LSEPERYRQQEIVSTNRPRRKDAKKKAQIIGISKYDHDDKFPNLELCENGANTVYNILSAQDYIIPSNSILVGRVEWAKMRDEVMKFFMDQTLKPDDTLFFYFSGHGYLDRNTGRTYLSSSEIHPDCPESRGIPFDQLATYLTLSNSERVMAVLDCCYSGAFGIPDGGKRLEYEYAKIEKGEELAHLANLNMVRTAERLIGARQGKYILASSLEEEKSFRMDDQSYSLFTYFVIQGLKGANGEAVDTNGYVTAELLGRYVNKKILEIDRIKQKLIRNTGATVQVILAYYPTLSNVQQQASQKDHLLQLLKEGKIKEFNESRKKNNYSRLSFYNVDLSCRDLSHIDLGNTDLNLVNLKESKLHHAKFAEANLLAAQLSSSDLSRARLSRARLLKSDLSRARLSFAKLSEANLAFANLSAADLSAAKLSGASLLCADLSFAYLRDVRLQFANLSAADLSKADLLEADLSEARLQFANLSNANLTKANLSNANLSEARLSKADLTGANLSEADLTSARLSNANLTGADLSKADLTSARLSFTWLSNANLTGADLSNAKLLNANLTGADLSNAKLLNANLTGADLSNANLTGADLSNANLTGADLTSSIIIGVEFNEDNLECKNASFDSKVIIDNELLSRHFRNSNSKDVPLAVKDRKNLIKKLRNRILDREMIDLYFLSYSYLPDSSS
jgi:uncharacterized protein YjbI with pentapeptide repeats